jgi:isoquinoline 1-oxidoreductase alpha subunit
MPKQTRRRSVVTIEVNDEEHALDIEPEMPLLWAIRNTLGLTGTKFGCGIAQCGACTVHIDGEPARSCITPVGTLAGRHVTTIESLGGDHPVQQAWIEGDVPQCGYCQSGQIMAAVALLRDNQNPTDADIDREMINICRCGTYHEIRAAIHRAADMMKDAAASSRKVP